MRKQINPKVLVNEWTPKKTKQTEEKVEDKTKEHKIVMNNGWSMFYQKHRPKDMKSKDFAMETGIHPYTLSRWDKGVGSPNFRLFFFFLEYVADKEDKPIEEVFSELYSFVLKYGTEFKK